MGTLANSEDPDEMPQNVLFLGLHYVLRQNQSLYKKNTMCNFLGEIIISNPSIYKMDHPDMTVSRFVENSIGLKWDKPFSSFLSIV